MGKTRYKGLRYAFGMPVRSDLRAGRTVCYQEIDGYWYPIIDPNNPIPPPLPPNSDPTIQWLDCKSCNGTSVGPGQLSGATCEVCFL